MTTEVLLQILGGVADVAGVTGAIISALVLLRLKLAEQKMQEDVQVLLRLEGEEGRVIALPLALKRRDLGRAELLGRLGMLPMRQKGARFALRALSNPAFMQGINEVTDGKTSVLVIPCTEDEIDQFDL